jgi:hypothetical protein
MKLCFVDEFGHKGQGPAVMIVGILADAAHVRAIISGHIQLLSSRLLTNAARLSSSGALASARWFNAVAPECPKIL